MVVRPSGAAIIERDRRRGISIGEAIVQMYPDMRGLLPRIFHDPMLDDPVPPVPGFGPVAPFVAQRHRVPLIDRLTLAAKRVFGNARQARYPGT